MKKYASIITFQIIILSLIGCSLIPPKAKVPEMDPGFCMNCHQEVTPGLFQSWVESKHAKNGVHCMTCHIDHQAATEQKAMVFPDKCGECHKKQLEKFQESRHSIGFERMRIQGEYLGIPQEIRAAFCERCHSIEKRCNSCHTSHRFSLKEARDPDACSSCHLGPDHPHKEMYETSLHGTIYESTRGPRSGTSVCHLSHARRESQLQLWHCQRSCRDSLPVVDLKEVPISREEEERRRQEMLRVCTGCHSEGSPGSNWRMPIRSGGSGLQVNGERKGVDPEMRGRDYSIPRW